MPAVWVEAARPPRIPMTNAHASCSTPLAFFLLHFAWSTFAVVMMAVVLVAFLSIKGRSVTWLVRKTKCNLRGRVLEARPSAYRRRVLRLQSHGSLDVSVLRQGE